ncbi:MAG: hypothetical protein ACR2KA_10510 [Opitutales bacterium]
MQPPISNSPTKLKIRAYDCKASAVRVKEALGKLVETSLAFNESWLLGEFNEGSRIGGLNQYGDIVIRHFPRRPKSELTIEYRAGDEALALVIEATLGKFLSAKAPRMVTGSRRPAGLAYFLEMLRTNPVRRTLMIANAAIEEAHDLAFSDYQQARSELDFLELIPRLGTLQESLDVRIQKAYKEANTRHPDPKVCLHEGRRVFLRHRFRIFARNKRDILDVHFAKMPGGRVLVGWVEESAA